MKADRNVVSRLRGWQIVGLALAFGLAGASAARAQTCPIVDDNANVTGVVNTYYPGSGTVAAGGTSVTINRRPANVGGADENIAVGDLLVIMQMQDADINSTNTDSYGNGVAGGAAAGQTATNSAGRYEYVIAQTAVAVQNGGAATVAMTITGAGAGNGTLFAYRAAASTTTTGQRTFQVVKVKRYRNATLNGLTASPWNGAVGGVVAVDVSTLLTLSALAIDVSGTGFRGALGQQLGGVGGNGNNTDYRRVSTFAAHGLKGEGAAGTPSSVVTVSGGTATAVTTGTAYPTSSGTDANGDRARGAPGNGGGGGSDFDIAFNDENSGGGGGGNGGPGGTGGNSWDSNAAIGGYGGAAFPATFDRVVLGGGGGAGTRNNSDGIPFASSGATGGGIILIRAANLAGTGSVRADGSSANIAAFIPDNDAGGGGGAGGSIVFVSRTGVSLANLTVQARGGRGSDAWPTQPPGTPFPGARHGPGGGGGGGVYFVSSAPNAASSVTGGADGTTTTAADSYGSGGGTGSANISGSTDINDVPGVQTCFVVTRAVVEGLRRVGGEIEFGVSSGRAVQGFNVIAETGGGKRVRLNDELLLSPLPDSLGPVLYRVSLRGLVARRVFVEELERGGRVREMGPYLLDDARLADAYVRLEDRAAAEGVREGAGNRMITGPRATGPRRPPPLHPRRRPQPGASGIKVEVGAGGLVRLEAPDWPAPPVGPRSTEPSQRRRLFVTNLGRPVPSSIQSGALEFQAEALSTDYTGTNAYLVTWNPPLSPESALTRSGFPLAPGFVRVEKNILYAPFLVRGADPWIWDYALTGVAGPFDFDIPRLAPGAGAVPVRIGIVGGSDHDHHVTAEVNGYEVGTIAFAGKAPAVIVGQVPLDALRAAGNQLTLRYDADGSTAEDPGIVFLDVVDLLAPQLEANVPAEVVGISAYDAQIPDLQGVDYLIVTHADFRAAADRLRSLKEQAGFRTAVVDVERAYDRWTGGVADVSAVRALVRLAAAGRSLKYVLLIGDDTYDTRDFTGQGLVSYLPTPYGWDGIFGRVPSETPLADLDDDGRPDVAIGRLPVRTAEEAAILVDKIARQASRPGSRRHLVAVDDSKPGDISFRGEGQALGAQLPGTVTFADVGAQGVTAARQTLIDALKAGVRTTSYFGHGGFDVLSDQGLLRTTDVAQLEGSNAETVFFTWTCETQWYVGDRRTLNEELLLVPNGGSVASLGPGGISDPVLQAALARRVYTLLLDGWTLGRAVQRAKSEAMAEDPRLQSVVDGFSVLGDPSLRP